MKKLILLTLIFFNALVNSYSQNDSLALVAFYNATNGASWTNNNGWLEPGQPVSQWYGVTVENNRVTSLQLYSNGITGYLPPEIGQLTSLAVLKLSNNQLTGSIPSEIGNLTELRELYLWRNQINGQIPDEIGQLTNLNILYLHDTQLSGVIPSQVGSLVNLGDLMLYNNKLSGSIPPEIGNLGSLKSLILYGNQLTGEIPTEMGQLVNLNLLDLRNNNLSGSIPQVICNLNLSMVDFSGNNFDEQSCSTIQCLLDKNVACGDGIQKTGFILTECKYTPWGQDSLALVALYNATNGPGWWNNTNWLNGPINTWHGVYTEMDYTTWSERVRRIQLSNNNLYGVIPGDIVNLSYLFELNLSGNQLQDTMPRYIFQMPELRILDLSFNMLNNNYWFPPEPYMSTSNLEVLNLQGNFLGNILWQFGMIAFPALHHLDLSGCGIYGELPVFLFQMPNLAILNLSYNQFNKFGDNEYYFPWMMSGLMWLDLSNNQFADSIPDRIGSLIYLQHLNLTGNHFTGTIPRELGQLNYLRELDLSNQEFSGEIPLEICNMANLWMVNFDNNYFDYRSCATIQCLKDKGVNFIGPQIQRNQISLLNECMDFAEVEALLALYNATGGENWTNNWNISTPISTWYGITVENNMVVGLNLVENNLNGNLPPEIGNLTELRELNLLNNQINGQIPEEIENLISLRNLNLAENDLSGTIPQNICNLSNLQSVNFGGNYFDESCLSLQCLNDRGVNFEDYEQIQKTGFSLTSGCIYNPVSVQDSLALVAFYNATNGASWENNTNWVQEGKLVASWYGVTVANSRVEKLILQNNYLTGTIPPEIEQLTNLTILDLQTNLLSGSIPTQVKALVNLNEFYLSYNNLSGSIPLEIKYLTNLSYFHLSNNQFTGSIPAELWNLTNLGYLNLSNNQFSGYIPAEMCNSTNLWYVDLGRNLLSGSLPSGITQMPNLSSFYANDNLFDSLPDFLKSNHYLYLNVSRNKLSFEDLEYNLDLNSTPSLSYSPQDSIGESKIIVANTGENLIHTLTTGGAYNQYQWYKDGQKLTGQTSAILTLNDLSLSNAGKYRCVVSNTKVTGLTLYSRVITIKVENPLRIVCTDFDDFDANMLPDYRLYTGITATGGCSSDDSIIIQLVDEIYYGLDENSGICPTRLERIYIASDQCGNVSEPCTQTYTFINDGNCELCIDNPDTTEDDVPYFTVILDKPDTTWISPPVARNGICCFAQGTPPPECVSFNVYLHEDAVGLVFDISSGAISGGAFYYKVDCGPLQKLGDFECLQGGRFYTITFCEPGNNPNTYSIQTVAGAISTKELNTRADTTCIGQMHVSGLIPSSINWSVKYPSGASDLIKYLDITADTANPIFRPDEHTPALIIYEACGTLIGEPKCNNVILTDCAEIIINTLPPVSVSLNVNVTSICEDSIPPITAQISNQDPNLTYTFKWFSAKDGSLGTGTIVSTSQTYTPPDVGDYSVVVTEVTSGVGCSTDTYNFNVSYDLDGPTLLVPPNSLWLSCNDPSTELTIQQWLATAYAEDEDGSGRIVYNDYSQFELTCGANDTINFWTVDDCGNETWGIQIIDVVDNIAPFISPMASNGTSDCSGDDPGSDPSFLAWIAENGGAEATDGCDPNLTWTHNLATQTWSGDPANNQITITFTVTDDCGNTAQTIATYSIVDNEPPLILCPVDVTLTASPNNCSETFTAIMDPTISDNFTDPGSLILTYELNGANNETGIGSITGVTFNVGVTTVTYTVFDLAGNSATCSFNVKIVDVTPPFINNSGFTDITEYADPNNCSKIPTNLIDPIFSDDCYPVSSLTLTWTMTGATTGSGVGSVVGQTFNVGVTTVTYTVTDPDGNTTINSFNVTILDTSIPAFTSGCPADIGPVPADIGVCDANVTIPVPSVSDSCNELYTIINDSPYRTSDTNASGTYPTGTTIVTWTIVDASGNSNTCEQTIIVTDEQSPVLNCPKNVFINGNENIPNPFDSPDAFIQAGGSITDNCMVDWSSFGIEYESIDTFYTYFVLKRNYTIIDYDGNKDICVHELSIENELSCAKHFHPAWEGTFGFDHMNINVTAAQLDGFDLEPGDEVGVFDGDICVGYGKVTQTIDQQNLLNIVVSRDDGTENGYVSGNEVSYIIWDCSASAEYPVKEVQCFNNQLNPIECASFASGATTFVLLSGFTFETQQVALNTGWNIMSLRVMPENQNLIEILKPLINEGKLKKVMDESGNTIEDWGVYGGWKNNIGDLKNTEGYKINITSLATLEVTGVPMQFPYEIQLNAGWNIISWPAPNEQGGIAVFQSLIDSGKLIKVMDQKGKTIENWGIFGGWKNMIGNFKLGEGYTVNVNGDCTLTIYEGGTKSEIITQENFVSTHFHLSYQGNGTDHMNIHLVNLAGSGIIEGDEIGIFDGDICVGSNTVGIQPSTLSIPVSSNDGFEEKNGFTGGNSIEMRLYRNGAEYPLTIQSINHSKPIYEKGSSLFAQVDLATGLEERTAGSYQPEINCYPNPFTDEVTIEIKLAKDSEVQVEVLNQLGQRIRFLQTSKMLNSGIHRLAWDGKNAKNQQVSTGIYHLRIRVEDSILIRKLVYSK